MSSDNISLTIGAGKQAGISYAIDAKLDSELQTDVKLGLSEWNSVFAIVKEDNATGKKQYSGQDTDITKGNHFTVQAGQQYQITQSAWAKIVNIAKQKMGIATPETDKPQEVEKTTNTEPQEVKVQEKTAEEEVKTILKNAKVNVADENIADIVDKYNAIIQYAKNCNKDITSEEFQADLKERITNYAKSLDYVNHELDSAEAMINGTETPEGYQIKGITAEDIKNNNTEAIQNAYMQFGKERVAYYDTNLDNVIDENEYLAASGATTEEDKAMVSENFKILAGEDGVINAEESAVYHWAMSKILDGENEKTANDITAEERMAASNAMLAKQLSTKDPAKMTEEEKEFLNNYLADEENIKNYQNFFGMLN